MGRWYAAFGRLWLWLKLGWLPLEAASGADVRNPACYNMGIVRACIVADLHSLMALATEEDKREQVYLQLRTHLTLALQLL